MLKLLMVRHGITDKNQTGAYLGWTDVELNDEGIQQAAFLRDKLQSVKIDGIYASPLKRAAKTAQIISEKLYKPVCYSELLKEYNFGCWDGLAYNEIMLNNSDEYNEWLKDPEYCIPNGESTIQVFNRNALFINEIMNKHKENSILIVTHLGVIRNMMSYLLDISRENIWRYKINCGSIAEIEICNDYAYLNSLNV